MNGTHVLDYTLPKSNTVLDPVVNPIVPADGIVPDPRPLSVPTLSVPTLSVPASILYEIGDLDLELPVSARSEGGIPLVDYVSFSQGVIPPVVGVMRQACDEFPPADPSSLRYPDGYRSNR
jgi:hypothetical protein